MYDKPKLQHDLVACSNNLVMFLMWPLYVINTKCAKVTVMSCWHGWHRQVAPTCLHRRKNRKKKLQVKCSTVHIHLGPLQWLYKLLGNSLLSVACRWCVYVNVFSISSHLFVPCVRNRLLHPMSIRSWIPAFGGYHYCHFPLSLNGRLHLER